MLARDHMVNVHRATEADARGIAITPRERRTPPDRADAGQSRRSAASPSTKTSRSGARRSTSSSGDHRPWIAWRGDRPIGFVTAGPSRDLPQAASVGELYVLDLEAPEAEGSVATALLEHACLTCRITASGK